MISVVVIAASAGGLDPLRRIVAAPVPCSAVFIVVHIGPHRSVLPSLLSSSGNIRQLSLTPARQSEAGHIYVALLDHQRLLGLIASDWVRG